MVLGAGGVRFELAKVIDPTANVLQALKTAVRRLDDLRINDRLWRDRTDKARESALRRYDKGRERAAYQAVKAEAQRLDALLAANAANVALALSKQEAQALAQDKRIAVLEQNQYQAGGKDIQRVESRSQSNFTWSQVIAGTGVLIVLLVELHTRGVI